MLTPPDPEHMVECQLFLNLSSRFLVVARWIQTHNQDVRSGLRHIPAMVAGIRTIHYLSG